jgi:hypothetical protein
MLEEFGMGVVESIAIKQTYRFRDCGSVSDWSREFRRTRAPLTSRSASR